MLRLPHLIPQGHNVMLDVTEMQRGSSKIFRNKHFIKQQKTSYCVEEQSQSSGAKRAEGSAGLWLILSHTLLPALCTTN